MSVAPYASIGEALSDEENIDWEQDKAAAQAITLAYAAKEIRDHLALMGVDAQISTTDPVPSESSIVLSVSNASLSSSLSVPADLQVPDDALGDQGYAITPRAGRLYITANDRVGALNGAYGLLGQLGFAWFDPFETHQPSASSLSGPISWSPVRERPRVKLRGFWIYGDATVPDEFAVWLARNRFNVGGRAKGFLQRKLGLKGWGGEHDLLQQEFSRPGLFEEHPDWYALVDGMRQPVAQSGTYFNPAFANAEAANYFADRMIQRLEGGDLQNIDILNIWPTDDRFNRFDRSPAATALGNETDNLLQFYSVVGKRFREAFADGRLSRNVVVAGISYYLTMRPPSNRSVSAQLENTDYLHLFYLIERDWSGHIGTDLVNRDGNRKIIEDLSAWSSVADFNYGVVEYHNLSGYAALGVSDFPFLASNYEVLTEGRTALHAYMHPLLRNPGPRRLTNHLLSELAWADLPGGTSADSTVRRGEQVIQEFFSRRYGEHATEWREIHELMSQSVENAKEIFGTNSLYWLLFRHLIWAEPPYSDAEATEFIPRYRTGGVQEVPGTFPEVATVRASFRGLDESTYLQQLAADRWQKLLGGSLDPDVRRHMEGDVEWFAATASRYRLMAATCDFVWARHHQLDVDEPRSRIAQEISLLRESAVIQDTISPVDQRSFLDFHRTLADIP